MGTILTRSQIALKDDAKKNISDALKRADQFIRKKDFAEAESEIEKAKKIDPSNAYTLAMAERLLMLKNELEKEKPVQQTPQKPSAHGTEGTLSAPPKQVSSWITPPSSFGSTEESYATTQPAQELSQEKTVAVNFYKDALLEALADGNITPSKERHLNELRSILELTDADHQQVFLHVLSNLRHKHRPKILVVDDDIHLLELLASSLEEHEFEVTAIPTSDEAFALLRKFTPDLILCDINLETSTMGGFTFYEKVQEIEQVQNVPFMFLTGLTDEAFVRVGKEIGADDYLMKPISEQTLVATLRGKLKRFKQLHTTMGGNPHPVVLAS